MNLCTECGQHHCDTTSPDTNVEANRQLLLDRSRVGLRKYGVTTDKNPLSHRQWLRHALEECLDMANYLQAAITQLDQENELLTKINDCDVNINELLTLSEDTSPSALMGIGDYFIERHLLFEKLREVRKCV